MLAERSRYSAFSGLATALKAGWRSVADEWRKAVKPRRGSSKGEAALGSAMTAGGANAYPYGQSVETMEQVRKFRLWKFVAIRCIAEEWARQQASVGFRRSPGSVDKSMRHKMLSTALRKKSFASLQAHEEIELADSDYALAQLLRNPNQPDTSYSFFYRLAQFLELTGRNYWWKVRNRLGDCMELWTLFPQWVTPVPGSQRLVDKYIIRPQGIGYNAVKPFELDADDVVPFLYPSPLTMIGGHSPTQAGAEWTDEGEAMDASKWFMFQNAHRPDMVINTDHEVFGKNPFTQSQLAGFYSQLEGRLKGTENAHRPIVFNPGMKAEPWKKTPQEMDFVNSGDQNRTWQMAVHKVSSTIAGISEDENYASACVHVANFIQRTMGPKYAMVGQIVTENLAAEFDPNAIVFWQDNPPTDPDQLNKDLDLDMRTGIRAPNEARQVRGLEPYPHGGDNPMINGIEFPWVTEDVQMPQNWTQADENRASAEAEQADKEAKDAKDEPPTKAMPAPSLNGHHKRREKLIAKAKGTRKKISVRVD